MDRFRKSATAELNKLGQDMSLVAAKWLSEVRHANVMYTCATCHHVQKQGSMFCKKYNMVPPVAIIVDATKCEGYSDHAEIPF